jgi:Zn-dependent alcohol dehydrogenase
VTPETVYFEPVRDETKIAVFSVGMVGFTIIQVAKTVRALFGR